MALGPVKYKNNRDEKPALKDKKDVAFLPNIAIIYQQAWLISDDMC